MEISHDKHGPGKLLLLEHRRSHSSSSSAVPSSVTVSSGVSCEEREFLRETLDLQPDKFINNIAFTDFTFRMGTTEIGLSGVVLAANSDFIREKIEKDKCKTMDVSALEVEPAQLLELVEPLYNGRLVLSSRTLINFVMFSALFEFEWMFACSMTYLKENIKPDLVFDMLDLSLRPQNCCIEKYQLILKICGVYLTEGSNMSRICSFIKENKLLYRLNRDIVEYLSKVDTTNLIELVSLILCWLKLDPKHMDIVPSLLNSFDFGEVFKQNDELAEDFFTHVITGDYTVDIRKRIMNLSFQSCKNIRHKGVKSSFRLSRSKSSKRFSDDGDYH